MHLLEVGYRYGVYDVDRWFSLCVHLTCAVPPNQWVAQYSSLCNSPQQDNAVLDYGFTGAPLQVTSPNFASTCVCTASGKTEYPKLAALLAALASVRDQLKYCTSF